MPPKASKPRNARQAPKRPPPVDEEERPKRKYVKIAGETAEQKAERQAEQRREYQRNYIAKKREQPECVASPSSP